MNSGLIDATALFDEAPHAGGHEDFIPALQVTVREHEGRTPAEMEEMRKASLKARRTAKQSRNELTKKFLSDIHRLWEEQGEGIMRRSAFYEPTKTLQIIASLLPKQLEVTTTELHDIPDEKIDELLTAVSDLIEGRIAGASAKVIEGKADARDAEQVGALQALPEAERIPS